MKQYVFAFCLSIFFLSACSDEAPVKPGAPVVGVLSIPKDSVILDPYGVAPLSLQIKYSWPEKGRTKVIVRGKNGSTSDIERVFDDAGNRHSVAVAGLYANYENSVDVILIDEKGETIAQTGLKVKTGALPPKMPAAIAVEKHLPASAERGLNLVSNFSTDFPQVKVPLMIDNYGDIRWLLDYTAHPVLKNLSYDCGIAQLKNGNYYFGDVTTNAIYEVDILGKVVNSWPFPGYTFHHEVIEKPDGNFIVAVDKNGSRNLDGLETIEDYIIEIDRQSGNIVYEWDLKESLDERRKALTTNPNDWIHVNAVCYDPNDNTIIVSGRTQGIIKLDYSNRVRWILSPHKGWGRSRRDEDLGRFLLTPLDASGNVIADTAVAFGTENHKDFEWSWYQHSTRVMPNGDLLLFDNGSIRNFDSTKKERYSRAVVYRIDPAAMTVRQVWEYGRERGLETYSRIVSGVQYLPASNHILFCPGHQVVNNNGKGGKMVEIDYATKQVVFEMSISSQNSWGFHRAMKIGAY